VADFLSKLGVGHKPRSIISRMLYAIDKSISMLRIGLIAVGLLLPFVFSWSMTALETKMDGKTGAERIADGIVETINDVDLDSALDKTGIRLELEQAMLYQSVSASLALCASRYDRKAYGQMHDFYQRRNGAAFAAVSEVSKAYFDAAQSRSIGPADILRGAKGGLAETTAITHLVYQSMQGEDLDEKGCQSLRRRVQSGALHLKAVGLRS
jgi:hypothetical protein